MLRNRYSTAGRAWTVFEPEQIAFLETGCALIVGSVEPDGAPLASRGWGLDVLGPDDVLLVLDADETRVVDHVAAGGRLAVTAADVRTLRSIQLKGRATSLRPASKDLAARAERYVEQFFTDVVETDGTDPAVLERLVPSRYVACSVTVEELFDQTPGPAAGSPLRPGS